VALERSGASIFEEWHEDSFEVPEGGVLLTTRPSGAKNQAFRMGATTYAFQYHIEVGETLAQEWHDGWSKMHSLPEREQQALAEVLASQIASGDIKRGEVFVKHFIKQWVALAPGGGSSRGARL
jgi:GMP synthase-like glutamine amidotransferase